MRERETKKQVTTSRRNFRNRKTETELQIKFYTKKKGSLLVGHKREGKRGDFYAERRAYAVESKKGKEVRCSTRRSVYGQCQL